MANDIEATRAKIRRYLDRLVDDYEITSDHAFTFQRGSTRTFVEVVPHGRDNTVVHVWAFVATAVRPSPALYQFLVRYESTFGHLALADDDDDGAVITFNHSLLGEHLDWDEFNWVASTVTLVADELDDELVETFGGRRYQDDTPDRSAQPQPTAPVPASSRVTPAGHAADTSTVTNRAPSGGEASDPFEATLQGANQLSRLSAGAFDLWGQFGRWLGARYGDPRVNSVGHIVVPGAVDGLAFMVGVDETDHGVVVDLHTPFLIHVARTPDMLEIVAMNSGLASLGAVHVFPEDPDGLSFGLELRHQVHASLLTETGLCFYAELLPRLSSDLFNRLQPAFGGQRPPSD